MKIGSAKYGGQYTKKKYFKLKDGEATYRILPPLGELANKGVWAVFHKVHYGYKTTEGKLRPFLSSLVENRKTKMVEVPDAAHAKIQKLKTALEMAKKAGNQAMVDKLNILVGPKARFNLDNNHYMNVIDTQGNIGVLAIRHRAKLALDAEIKRLRESGVDPLGMDSGRFFTFRRTGMGLDTSFQVTVAKQKVQVNGKTYEEEIIHTLTPDIVDRLANEAQELGGIFKKLTAEQIQRIVETADEDGKSSVIDEIFNTQSTQATTDGDDGPDQDEEDSTTSTTGLSTATAAPVTSSAPAQTQAPTQQAAPQATLVSQAPSEKVSQPAAPKVELATPSQVTGQAAPEQSTDEFLKSIGL